MNYSIVKNVFVGLFLFLCIVSCKNEEDHSPCGRPDCYLTKINYSENGTQVQTVTQTYTTAGGQKLLSETYWDIPASSASVEIINQYDNQARLIETSTTNTTNNGSNTSKVTYEYDAMQPERVARQDNYGNANNITSYSLYSYTGILDKATRIDLYNLSNQIVAHKEFTYDTNGNLVEELDYQGTTLNSRITYSNYTDGEWRNKVYEILDPNPGLPYNREETTRTFENCTLKSTLIEYNTGFGQSFVNTIVDNLIVSTQSFDVGGNQINRETTYEYDCN